MIDKPYEPNFNDPRVIKKTERVLGFAFAQMSENKPRELSKKYLDKVFGQQQNRMSKYLREKCLITTNKFYRFNSVAGSQVKAYTQNINGLNELLSKINFDETRILSKMYTYLNLYCITSLENPKKTALALQFARDKFGTQLEKGSFSYYDKSDRLWGGTQSLKKEVKRQLHSEYGYCYEYDIEAAAPTLLYQFARNHGCKELNEIEFYLQNKSVVRNELSKHLNIPLKDIKEVITALFAGARMDQAIAGIINNQTKLNALRSNLFIAALKKDIAKMWKSIKPEIGLRYNRKTQQVEKKISSSTKWSKYFELEREVLEVVIDHLSSINCSKYVLEHDGWTTTKRLDTNVLEQLIKDKTGYVLKIEEEVLTDMFLVATINANTI